MGYVTRSMPVTANNITRSIENHIKRDNGSASRINTTGIYDKKIGKYRKSGARKGFSDLACCIRGRAIAIEIKKGDDEQRDDQVTFQKEWESAGGIYYIATSYEEFITWYNKLLLSI